MRSIKLTLLAALCMFAFLSVTASAETREEFHRSISADNVDSFRIMNVNGKIEIESWDGGDIDVMAIKRTKGGRDALDRVSIDISTGSVVTVKTVKDRDSDGESSFFQGLFHGLFHGGQGVSVDYEIKLPDSVNLSMARSTNGYVEVRGVSGIMELKSTNGNIKADNSKGEITAGTTNGSIYVSGDSDVVSAHTTNGKIDVLLPEIIENDVRLRTTNGSITLHLSRDADAQIKCRTTNGHIGASGFQMVVENISKRSLEATLGEGGRLIDASTTNGSITILER